MISVIIPIYKSARYLKQCIDNVLLQIYKDYKIIIVVDESTYDISVICKKYAEGVQSLKFNFNLVLLPRLSLSVEAI